MTFVGRESGLRRMEVLCRRLGKSMPGSYESLTQAPLTSQLLDSWQGV